MNQQMNADEVIERVLAGLRDARSPIGMESRIVDAAQNRAYERRAGLLSMRPVRFEAWTVAALAIILCSLAASLAVQKKGVVRQASVLPTLRPTSPKTAMRAYANERVPAKDERSLRRTRRAAVFHRRSTVPEPVSAEEELAISEMNAPSRPAPPLPLTHQERLLAEAAQRGGSEDLSSLRPEVRARQMELSKAEFRNFFEPPIRRDDE